MKYFLSQKAEDDLEEIWFYSFRTWSKEQADEYIRLIISQIEFIAENPNSGTDISEIRKGYFKSRIKSHYIFYKIDSEKQSIQIIRILHGMMDIETRIGSE